MHRDISIREDSRVPFGNKACECIGTGRMGLALQEEYQKQLRAVQALCGFRHIRGHGLFCDDMAIWQGDGRYCFTYLDRVMDSYRAAGLRPFLEIGFMPDRLASGQQKLFYWKANTTPPADEGAWVRLVEATLRHLCERYGEREVSTWPVEVWNEPNLPGFWEGADQPKYLRLYEITSQAVKRAVPGMKVGGPAICGTADGHDWIRAFLSFCLEKDLPVDFVTRHFYMAQNPEMHGRYCYHGMCDADFIMRDMQVDRETIDSFPAYRGLPLHVTEFNTSYSPFCPIHDTCENAALIASMLARMGDLAASYSYWTFGDVFEEQGVPSRPFHGGFGLMANGLIPKPTLWTFAFFSHLEGEAVWRDDSSVVTREADGWRAVLWNTGDEPLELSLSLPGEGRQAVIVRWVDREHGNPLALWHALGEPASLTEEQLAWLREAGRPMLRACTAEAEAGRIVCPVTLQPHAVAELICRNAELLPDEGYLYGWYSDGKKDACDA